MHVRPNYQTKKELKEAVRRGDPIEIFAPGLGTPERNGTEFISGPWDYHKWYAKVTVKDGKIVRVE